MKRRALDKLEDELLDFSEDREDLVDFYRKQFATWQKLGAALNGSFKSNRSALEKDAAAVKALGELESIWQMPAPVNATNQYTNEALTLIPTATTAVSNFAYRLRPAFVQIFQSNDLRRTRWISDTNFSALHIFSLNSRYNLQLHSHLGIKTHS